MMYQQYPAGWVEVICGCMFAGKTEELIRRIKTLQYGKKKVKVFKPRIDNRYAIDEIASHSGYKVSCICIDDAKDLDGKYATFGKVIDGYKNIEKIVSNERVADSQTGKLVNNLTIKKALIDLNGKTYDWDGVQKMIEEVASKAGITG